MAEEFGGKVEFRVENYGMSELARRYGVRRYPAIFVGEVLAASPKDFGFYGTGEGTGEGRYTPFKSAEAHQRFRTDLEKMIRAALAGGTVTAATATTADPFAGGIPALPAFEARDLQGRPLSRNGLTGRAVIVEFWATWCPPCRSTLRWLGDLKARHGDRLEVIAVAVESDSADVRRLADQLDLPVRWVMGSPALARSFGDVSGVPTLHLFGPEGRGAGSYFGASPGLHDEVEERLTSVLSRK